MPFDPTLLEPETDKKNRFDPSLLEPEPEPTPELKTPAQRLKAPVSNPRPFMGKMADAATKLIGDESGYGVAGWTKTLSEFDPENLAKDAFRVVLGKNADLSKPMLTADVSDFTKNSIIGGTGIQEGVDNFVKSLVEGGSSPEGIAKMAALPKMLSEMAASAPDDAANFGKAIANKDTAGATESLLNYMAKVAPVGEIANKNIPLGAGDKARILASELNKAPLAGTPTDFTKPVQFQTLAERLMNASTDAVTPSDVNFQTQTKGMLPKVQSPRPTVPETPPEPERDLTVIDEIRQKSLQTKGQIQAAFPQLSREQAAELRKKAWDNYTPPEMPTTPEAAAPVIETPKGEQNAIVLPRKALSSSSDQRPSIVNISSMADPSKFKLGSHISLGPDDSSGTVVGHDGEDLILQRYDGTRFRVTSDHTIPVKEVNEDATPSSAPIGNKEVAPVESKPSTPAPEPLKELDEMGIEELVKQGKPVPAKAIEDNGLEKQASEHGYIKNGDVYTPSESAKQQPEIPVAPIPKSKEQTTLDKLGVTDYDDLDAKANSGKLKPAQVRQAKKALDTLSGKLDTPDSEKPTVLAFGGVKTSSKPGPYAPEPPPETPSKLAAAITRRTPGLSILRDTIQGVKSLLLPTMKSPEHLQAAEELGSKLGAMHRRSEVASSQLRPFSKNFDNLGLDRKGVSPADNAGIKFMSDMSQGRPLTGWMKNAAVAIQKQFTDRLKALQDAGAPLQTVRENYFPGMWTRESRLAFNAAMETMGKDFDPADATPEQKAKIKALVDEYLENGTASDKDALSFLTRRPMKGKESFRKQKVFDDIMDAAELGLRPISNNPIDLVKLKLAEMDRSIMANEYFQALKAKGQLKVINPYDEVPEGWEKINDKYGTIYGKPTVTIPEHVDKTVYEGLLNFAKSLGVRHERSMQFPPGPGTRALGLSYQGMDFVRTKFATELSVLAHEIGHQLDHKYDLWNAITGGERGNERNSPIQKDLRAIADLTGRSENNIKTKPEKIAQMVEAYVHAPEMMKDVAPTVFKKFDDFIRSKPELAGLPKIKPGIELTKLTSEKYVGLPIMGYRIVPEAHGDVINNYLSSSLYNNEYFGGLYKAWMTTANVLNQAQLGLGSAFHAGFTTGEAMVSSGANVLKDIYGVARGNRKITDLGGSISKSVVAAVRTPIIGDRVLNAWKNPDGTMSPRVAEIVRAAELGGGGFKMETGLSTGQTTQMLRNWYSGQRLQAAARSPIALTELAAKPIMELLVPRQKAGVFAELAGRIIDQNPGKSLEDLTPQFRQAWNRVDARLGQVRYDRLFANNTAKNVMQGLVRAPGWTGGTIAEIGGGFTDVGNFLSEWVKIGKLPENMPDRTAYVLSLLIGTTIANGVLTYALTGQKPTGMDYFAFRTGKKDAQGNVERFVLPTYMKDIVAYARHPGETILNKTHPLISMINDIFVKNKDYYGVEVHSRDASLPEQALQDAKYVVKSFEPFWIRGAIREKQEKQRAAAIFAPYFGVMPAPRSVTQSPAENLAHDLMMEQTPTAPRTQEEADRSMAKARASSEPYLLRETKKLTAHSAVMVYEKANPQERKMIFDVVAKKVNNSKVLTDDEKAAFLARLH